MTVVQQEEFFEKVKSKKIKYSPWSNNRYFLPHSFNKIKGMMVGDLYLNNIIISTSEIVEIREGFGFDGYGYNWEFVEKELTPIQKCFKELDKQQQEERKCTCSSSDLFNYGCKCGGK